ncbi:aminodeoxychorismate synthase component I [Vibrio tapetis]|uniref:aminodeoxychorismate synthase n=1 Tax=Vibrio tapetis subsp. tapetis TaxID=1671868 RepID=A0A2N8ZA88_9VIBR|nr:aminodeoxychorismate synthase component I [Vibrio tapetis]SON48818.1 aminodeoxychorismate synthase, subunit I [Vibrio tapetis subsp. tapetis]
MNNTAISNISIIPINYSHDLTSQLFANIESQPWAMLLRSVCEHHPDNRYDILVANPIATITTYGDQSFVTKKSVVTQSKNDPFTLIDELLSDSLPYSDPIDDIPFIGGALGYFGYDLGRRVESMPTIATHDINTADMAVGIYSWAVIADHHTKCAYVVGENPEIHWQWLNQQRHAHQPNFCLTSSWQSNMNKEGYAPRFETVQEYLRSGDCYQINLAQRFKAAYKGSEWQAYQKLETANGSPFSAFIRTDECAILSVSPERFLKLDQKQIETKPIKGTRPRNQNSKLDKQATIDLANAEKDQAENLMIVDLLRNDIGRVAKPGTVTVPKLFAIESFPAVHHLVSTIQATLDDEHSASDLLRACFPGGSITGAPKIRAMQIIEELEPHRRNMYCGSIGYISRCRKMDTSITIRTLVAYNNNLYAWAGGGLVADSKLNEEYQETLDKLSKILPILEYTDPTER